MLGKVRPSAISSAVMVSVHACRPARAQTRRSPRVRNGRTYARKHARAHTHMRAHAHAQAHACTRTGTHTLKHARPACPAGDSCHTRAQAHGAKVPPSSISIAQTTLTYTQRRTHTHTHANAHACTRAHTHTPVEAGGVAVAGVGDVGHLPRPRAGPDHYTGDSDTAFTRVTRTRPLHG